MCFFFCVCVCVGVHMPADPALPARRPASLTLCDFGWGGGWGLGGGVGAGGGGWGVGVVGWQVVFPSQLKLSTTTDAQGVCLNPD
jgi:hypothetical protein